MLLIKNFRNARKLEISFSLLCGFLFMLSADAAAQNAANRSSIPNNSSQNIRADDADLYRIAKVQGYNDGLRIGAKDGRKKRKDPQKIGEYKNADNGFEIYFGERKEYKQIYGKNNKLYKQAYKEKKKAYRQTYRDGFFEGYNKVGGGGSINNQSKVTVRRKRGVFGRLRRIILRH